MPEVVGFAEVHDLRGALDAPGFLVAVTLVVVVIVLLVAVLRRRGGRAGRMVATGGALLLAAVALVGIAEMTLVGSEGPGAPQRIELDPRVGARGWSGIAWRPVLDNVTLFVPLGAALALLWCRRRWVTVLAVALGVSLSIEAYQWAVPTGRIANSADVLANGAGAALGIMLARTLGGCRTPRPLVASRRR